NGACVPNSAPQSSSCARRRNVVVVNLVDTIVPSCVWRTSAWQRVQGFGGALPGSLIARPQHAKVQARASAHADYDRKSSSTVGWPTAPTATNWDTGNSQGIPC